MKVDFTIPEVDVRAECGCGYVCFGDSAVDAFVNWWQHKAEIHREIPEETDPVPELESPTNEPSKPDS